jgi:anti-anti-sigma factor
VRASDPAELAHECRLPARDLRGEMQHSTELGEATNRVELSCPTEVLAVVELVGDHDLGQSGPITEALHVAAARRRHVVVDLSRCGFFDSTVACLLFAAQESVDSYGGQFALVVPVQSCTVARTVEVMGLDELFVTYPTLEDALAGTEHVMRIRDERVLVGERGGFHAECSCGWTGEHRTGVVALHLAREDARRHEDTPVA